MIVIKHKHNNRYIQSFDKFSIYITALKSKAQRFDSYDDFVIKAKKNHIISRYEQEEL